MKREEYTDDSSSSDSEYNEPTQPIQFPIILIENIKHFLDEPDTSYGHPPSLKNPPNKKRMTKKNKEILDEINKNSLYKNDDIISTILDSNLPLAAKKSLIIEYQEKETTNSEKSKFLVYLNKVLNIPFGKYKKIGPTDGNIPKFLSKLRKNLDDSIAGHSETKGEIIDYISSIMRNPNSNTNILALQSPPGCGKCLGYNTPVLMYNGLIKKVQNILVGEFLMGDDGTSREVLALGTGKDTMYRITHETSRKTYTVNSEHILSLVDNNGDIVDIPIKQYLDSGKKYMGYSTPIPFKKSAPQSDLVIAYELGKTFPYNSGAFGYIMELIKHNAYSVRLKYLEGIIFSSGVFTSTESFEIMLKKIVGLSDIYYLIDSLGFLRTRDDYEGYNRISIKIPPGVFKNPESFEPEICMEDITIQKLQETNYYGFEITGNKRFVLGNFIVTHNTKFVRALGKALGLPFQQISFGGINDPSILTGHDFTYIGSKPGKIYDVLAKAKSMNSIVMMDEIDKIGDIDSPKTKEIYGVLTHILDKEQNSEFYDHYIGTKVPLDLSKILFIASFNHEYNIDPIVLNRMKVIKIKESTIKEKIEIVKKFTIPEIIKNLNLQSFNIEIPDSVIKYIIINKTVHEPGMRNINKNFNTLLGKINTMLYLESASVLERRNITKDLVYEKVFLTRKDDTTILVTNELVDNCVPKRTSANELYNNMYN